MSATAGRASRADLRQPGDRLPAGDDVPGAARRGGAVRRRPDRPGRDRGRPGRHLHADGARGRGGDARVCPDRRGSLGGVRRVRRGRARDADRGRQAGGDRDGVLRHRGEPGGGVQADPGPGDRALAAQAALVRGAAAAAGEGAARRLGGTSTGRSRWRRREPAGCVPVAATDPLYILYTSGTTGKPKGVVRDNGGHAVALRLEHAARLRHPARGRVLGRLRHRVGGRALLHRVRAAAGRVHHGAVRGQAGGDAGRGGLLAGHRGAPGQGPVHRPDRVPGDQEGRPGGQVRARPGPVEPALSVPGRGAARPGDLPVGPRTAGHPGHRPLVADGDGLGHRRQPDGPGADGSQAGVSHRAHARVRPARGRPVRRGRAGRRGRRNRPPAAAAARLPAHPVGRRPALTPTPTCPSLPRLLPDRRRRLTSTRTGTCSSWAGPTM